MQGNSRRFFVLNDGISIGLTPDYFYVDVNRLKKSNRLSYGVFQIKIDEKALEHYDDAFGDVMCYSNVFTCADWVLVNENMDYLHCNDLS